MVGIALLILWLLSRMALLSWADLSYVLAGDLPRLRRQRLHRPLLPERTDHAVTLGGHGC